MGDPLQAFMVAEHGLKDAIEDLAIWRGGFLQDAQTRIDAGEDPGSLVKGTCQGVDIGFAKVGTIANALQARMLQIEAGFGRMNLNGPAPQTSSFQKRDVEVSQSKAVQSLRNFNNSREDFIGWNDKLINALSRILKGSREVLKHMNSTWAKMTTESDVEKLDNQFQLALIAEGNKGNPSDSYASYKMVDEDLYYILVDKTEGEAAGKVKTVEAGQGILAYHKIYWWYVKTSGIALQDRSRKVMYPEPIKHEEKIMEGIENWEQNLKVLDQHGAAYVLNDQSKLIAIEVLMSNFPTVHESIERGLEEDNPKIKFEK